MKKCSSIINDNSCCFKNYDDDDDDLVKVDAILWIKNKIGYEKSEISKVVFRARK